MKVSLFYSVVFSILGMNVFSQDTNVVYEEPVYEEETKVENTFSSTRIINGHSVETLKKGTLEFRVEHKFGDLAGSEGGVQNFFGLDNSSDIRIAFEYGITDKLMVGLGRSKGINDPYRSLIDGFVKYRLLHQEKGKMPLSLAVLGNANITYMKASQDISQVSHFPKFAHRLSYATQVNIARKFGNRVSLALMPTYVWRNYVRNDEQNGVFSLGAALNVLVGKRINLTLEYYQNMEKRFIDNTALNSLSVAVEWLTFGHAFKVYLTNARGFGEVQYIPSTNANWLKGQFRIGFCISRKYRRD